MKLTPWYLSFQKPTRTGVYERKFHDGKPLFSFFDGHYWYLGDETPDQALHGFQYYHMQADEQMLPWRGVAK
ncbi:MAG: hypothetical protein AB3X44_16150 [Leptothrix sp. (in: b-proteobacteria)]